MSNPPLAQDANAANHGGPASATPIQESQETAEKQAVFYAKASVSSWCPRTLLFRRGPTRPTYEDAIRFMEPGYQLIWMGEVCVFQGDHWQVGQKKYSIEKFNNSLVQSKPDRLLVALMVKAAHRAQTDFTALHDFFCHPSHSRYFAGPMASTLKSWLDTAPQDIEGETVISLLDWIFEEDAQPDEEEDTEEEDGFVDDEGDDKPRVRSVYIVALVIGEADGKHQARLRHLPETWVHTNHKEGLMAFWQRKGGRDPCLQQVCEEQNVPMEDQFLVHAILGARKIHGRQYYLVEWVGYDHDAATWQPRESIAPSLVSAYHKAHPARRRKRRTY